MIEHDATVKTEALRLWALRRGFDVRMGAVVHIPHHDWEPWMPEWAIACPYVTERTLLRPLRRTD